MVLRSRMPCPRAYAHASPNCLVPRLDSTTSELVLSLVPRRLRLGTRTASSVLITRCLLLKICINKTAGQLARSINILDRRDEKGRKRLVCWVNSEVSILLWSADRRWSDGALLTRYGHVYYVLHERRQRALRNTLTCTPSPAPAQIRDLEPSIKDLPSGSVPS